MQETNFTERTAGRDFYCDFCAKRDMGLIPAEYDAKTIWGPWAYLCKPCFERLGVGLGMGKGQKLKRENTDDD